MPLRSIPFENVEIKDVAPDLANTMSSLYVTRLSFVWAYHYILLLFSRGLHSRHILQMKRKLLLLQKKLQCHWRNHGSMPLAPAASLALRLLACAPRATRWVPTNAKAKLDLIKRGCSGRPPNSAGLVPQMNALSSGRVSTSACIHNSGH